MKRRPPRIGAGADPGLRYRQYAPALAFAAAVVLIEFVRRQETPHILGYSTLVLASLLSAAFDPQRSTKGIRPTPLSLVVDFVSLLLFGPRAMMLVALTGAVTQSLTDSPRKDSALRLLLNAAIAVVATQAAGIAYAELGGTLGQFAWPWKGVPIAAAVVAYGLVKSGSADFIVPLATSQPVNRSWPTTLRQSCPTYFIAVGAAAAFVELVHSRAWEVLPVAMVPLYFAYRTHGAYVNRLDDESRCRDVIESLDQGICVIDRAGRVTQWNDALARMVDCPSKRALGLSLVGAVPFVNQTGILRAIDEARTTGRPRALSHLELTTKEAALVLDLRVVPGVDDVTLLWQDVTELAREGSRLRRSHERLMLAAEGANDGLWEWDLRTQEFYVSERWSAMIGLPPAVGCGRPEEWFDRIHADDISSVKAAFEAHLSGQTGHVQHELRIRHEDGGYRWFFCRGVAVRGADRRALRIAGSLTDITERASAQERIRNAGFRDPLTGLCNRSVFVEGLGRRLIDLQQHNGARFAALYLDLDRFKVVNDSLGHLVGDELLIAVSRRLESCLRPEDALARLGGDEFAILLHGLGDEMQANAIAFRIQTAMSAPFSIAGREVVASVSIGIAFSRTEYTNPEEMMRDADTAMYYAKARGKARHELFDADMHARALDRLGLESDLRQAVKSNAFELYYQPIVSLASGMSVGFEALVRWKRNGAAISPAIFIPVAEELGLIESLGAWVLQEACRAFADWQRRFPAAALDCITVNVSTRQLMQQNFVSLVRQAVHEAGLKACDLRLEITETAVMHNPTNAAEVFKGLRDFGVKIYLDDFGTGYSSLSHLHKLPVDALKIDGTFVRSLLLTDRPAIVESILALARTLDTGVVAEGVETDRQARELERLGCRHAQGFYFSRPLPPDSVEALLVADRPLGGRYLEAEANPALLGIF